MAFNLEEYTKKAHEMRVDKQNKYKERYSNYSISQYPSLILPRCCVYVTVAPDHGGHNGYAIKDNTTDKIIAYAADCFEAEGYAYHYNNHTLESYF